MKKIAVKCDRCGQEVQGWVEPGVATSGFYAVGPGKAFERFARPGEINVCDKCMSADPLFRQEYGIPRAEPSRGVEFIATERRRQVEQEGWTAEHDDQWDRGELIEAARSYAQHAESFYTSETEVSFAGLRRGELPRDWPWEPQWWKPSNEPIRDLVKAGALIAAEIDRLLRKAR